MLKYWRTLSSGERRRRLEATAVALRRRPSGLERTVHVILKTLTIEFLSQYVVGDRCIVDILIPDRRLIIECDGWWHRKEARREADGCRDRWLEMQGFRVCRLSEGQIKRDALHAVLGALA